MNNYDLLANLDMEKLVTDLRNDIMYDTVYLRDTKIAGDNIMVTCPYHKEGMENHVSMGITLQNNEKSRKGTCHCFMCNITVDFLTMVGFVNGVDDFGQFGRKWIYKNYLVFDDSEKRKPIKLNIGKKHKEEQLLISEEEVNKYSQAIPNYVLNRGISIEVASYFKVGYDKEKNAAVFPVYDEDGICIFIQRRMINYKFFENTEEADKASLLYGLDKVYEQMESDSGVVDLTELYVVESIIDALYLWSNGKVAVATLQAVITDEHLELLKQVPIKNIIAAQDNDKSGNIGASLLRKKLRTKIIRRLVFPDGCKDVNDLEERYIGENHTTLLF
jgi:DNA primase